MMPMNSASEMSFRVPAPRRNAPMTRIEPIGSRATTEVLIERTRVWFAASSTSSAKVLRRWPVRSAVFSRTLSKTTIVSYSE